MKKRRKIKHFTRTCRVRDEQISDAQRRAYVLELLRDKVLAPQTTELFLSNPPNGISAPEFARKMREMLSHLLMQLLQNSKP